MRSPASPVTSRAWGGLMDGSRIRPVEAQSRDRSPTARDGRRSCCFDCGDPRARAEQGGQLADGTVSRCRSPGRRDPTSGSSSQQPFLPTLPQGRSSSAARSARHHRPGVEIRAHGFQPGPEWLRQLPLADLGLFAPGCGQPGSLPRRSAEIFGELDLGIGHTFLAQSPSQGATDQGNYRLGYQVGPGLRYCSIPSSASAEPPGSAATTTSSAAAPAAPCSRLHRHLHLAAPARRLLTRLLARRFAVVVLRRPSRGLRLLYRWRLSRGDRLLRRRRLFAAAFFAAGTLSWPPRAPRPRPLRRRRAARSSNPGKLRWPRCSCSTPTWSPGKRG